ncbi:MAG: LamG domain-containing protein, partial [Verrucomicrobia bacterium]
MQRNKPTTAARRIGRKCPALLAGALLLGAACLRAQGPELFVFWDFNDASNPTVATDKILGVPGDLVDGAAFSAPGMGHTGDPEDLALDLGFSQDGTHMDVAKAGFLNQVAADDKMTVSFWLVWNADITAGSSAFWMVSPSSANNQRGAQAHVPWSNNNIYFDTAGCCNGATQRISASITTFPDYFDGFFFLWHHFAFVKDGSTKRIYIDGKLFLEGTNTSPLPQDFTELIVGNLFTKNSSVAGLIDDFAVFGSALTEAEVAALASGTPPDQLPGVTFPAEPFLLSATPAAGPGAEPDAPVAIEILEGASPIDPASVKLTIDGQEITGAQVSKTGKTVKIDYQPATIWAPLSAHSVQVDFNDGQDRSIAYDFQTVNYGVLTAADKVEADTTKPGFVFRIHQGTDNTTSLARAETQLSGNDGDNLANPAAPGPAIGAGTPGPTPQSPIEFEIETVINMESTGLDAGEFNPNDTFPGIDGSSAAGYNGTAAEILTYAELPAGMVHLVVNSDDGFQVAAGNVRDVLRRQVGGEFNGGRGAADSLVRLYVEEAGIYPLRIVYFQGGGGASLELKMVKPDGTRVLLNDVANGSVPCYRATTSPTPSAVVQASPAPGQTGVEPDAPIEVVIQAGDTPVDPASVKLLVDGQDVGATVNQSG